jgi:hypothetical protein
MAFFPFAECALAVPRLLVKLSKEERWGWDVRSTILGLAPGLRRRQLIFL